ncbi:hypothetical protein J6590_103530, partial [Homalodisca vitripennis]
GKFFFLIYTFILYFNKSAVGADREKKTILATAAWTAPSFSPPNPINPFLF